MSRTLQTYPTLLIGVSTGALIVFTILPFISILIGAAPGGETSPLSGILGLAVFATVAALIHQSPTPRAAIGRGLLSLGVTITLIPAVVTLVFVLRTQAMVGSPDSEAHVHSFGVALSLLGGVIGANALLWGLVIGAALVLTGRTLIAPVAARA